MSNSAQGTTVSRKHIHGGTVADIVIKQILPTLEMMNEKLEGKLSASDLKYLSDESKKDLSELRKTLTLMHNEVEKIKELADIHKALCTMQNEVSKVKDLIHSANAAYVKIDLLKTAVLGLGTKLDDAVVTGLDDDFNETLADLLIQV